MNFSPAAFARVASRCVGGAALILVVLTSAPAATLTVNTTSDTLAGMNTTTVALFNASATRSLRGAIIAVNNDATGPHTINLPAGTYTLTIANATPVTEEDLAATGDLDIRKAVTIAGGGTATTIIQAGTTNTNGIDKVFSINPLAVVAGFPVTISGLTVRYGRNQIVNTVPGNNIGGGMDFDAGTTGAGSLSLTSVRFEENSTTNGDGGGLALFDGGTVTLSSCTFTKNTARSSSGTAAHGGAIFIGDDGPNGATVALTGCTLELNRTTAAAGGTPGSGGGLFSFPTGANVQIALHAGLVNGNEVGAGMAGTSLDGGGIYGSNLKTTSTLRVIGNKATRWGGGIYVVGGLSSVTNTTVGGNTAGSAITARGTLGGGGGVFVNNGNTTIANSRISLNSAGATSELDTNLAAATIDAPNNWLGSNLPNAGWFGTSGITRAPFLVLEASASPTTVVYNSSSGTGGTSTVTARITRNSVGTSGFMVPDGTTFSFTGSTLGSVSPTFPSSLNGVGSTVFTAGSTGGVGGATVTVDWQEVATPITVTVSPTITSANTTTFRVGAGGSFNVTASGFPAPSFSFTGSLPSGVTLSAAGLLSGTPAVGTGNASYPITITAANGVLPNSSQSFTLVVLSPWQFWQLQNFGANASNPAIAGDNADPDLDTIINLFEYAWGTNPNAASTSPVVIDTTTGYLRLTTPKVASASDLTYTVEVSADLVTWTTAGTVVLINTPTQLQVRDNVLLSVGPKRFIRLKLTRS